MSRCPGLTTLHLRDNQLENLDGFSEEQKELQYINLRYKMKLWLVQSMFNASSQSIIHLM